MSERNDDVRRVFADYASPVTLSGMAPGTPLLLALSGGPDSRLLLHLLASDPALTGTPVHLAHVNHGIRGERADRDEAFCRSLAGEYHFPIHVLRADVPAIAHESGESLESAARRVRYEYFSELMQQYTVPLLLTAHNANDNLETVLFRLGRGSGLAGLCGIAPVRAFAGGKILRPLLRASKADIVGACHTLGLSFVTDETNTDLTYARNRLRAEAVPALSAVVAHPERQVSRLCDALREDEAFLDRLAEDFRLAHERAPGVLSARALADAPRPIAKRVLLALVSARTDAQMENVHLDAVLHLCGTVGGHRELPLPGGLTVWVEGDSLFFSGERPAERPAVVPFDFPLAPGRHSYPDAGFSATLERPGDIRRPTDTAPSQNGENIYNPFIRDSLSFDIITAYPLSSLHWRTRRPGDTLLVHGVHRRLRKLQNEAAVPAPLRDVLPLLVSGDTVLWAPFVAARDGFPSESGNYRLTVERYADNPQT